MPAEMFVWIMTCVSPGVRPGGASALSRVGGARVPDPAGSRRSNNKTSPGAPFQTVNQHESRRAWCCLRGDCAGWKERERRDPEEEPSARSPLLPAPRALPHSREPQPGSPSPAAPWPEGCGAFGRCPSPGCACGSRWVCGAELPAALSCAELGSCGRELSAGCARRARCARCARHGREPPGLGRQRGDCFGPNLSNFLFLKI